MNEDAWKKAWHPDLRRWAGAVMGQGNNIIEKNIPRPGRASLRVIYSQHTAVRFMPWCTRFNLRGFGFAGWSVERLWIVDILTVEGWLIDFANSRLAVSHAGEDFRVRRRISILGDCELLENPLDPADEIAREAASLKATLESCLKWRGRKKQKEKRKSNASKQAHERKIIQLFLKSLPLLTLLEKRLWIFNETFSSCVDFCAGMNGEERVTSMIGAIIELQVLAQHSKRNILGRDRGWADRAKKYLTVVRADMIHLIENVPAVTDAVGMLALAIEVREYTARIEATIDAMEDEG